MFQRIYTASRLLDLRRHQLTRFLAFCKPYHIRQNICQRLHRTIQITGCECETIRIDIVFIGCPCLVFKCRNVYTHDILLTRLQIDLLFRSHQRCIQRRL